MGWNDHADWLDPDHPDPNEAYLERADGIRQRQKEEQRMEEAMIGTPEGLIRPEVQLTGTDGNAFALVARVKHALQQEGNDERVIEAFVEEAFSGDYDHVLATCISYAEVS